MCVCVCVCAGGSALVLSDSEKVVLGVECHAHRIVACQAEPLAARRLGLAWRVSLVRWRERRGERGRDQG